MPPQQRRAARRASGYQSPGVGLTQARRSWAVPTAVWVARRDIASGSTSRWTWNRCQLTVEEGSEQDCGSSSFRSIDYCSSVFIHCPLIPHCSLRCKLTSPQVPTAKQAGAFLRGNNKPREGKEGLERREDGERLQGTLEWDCWGSEMVLLRFLPTMDESDLSSF